MPDGRAPERDSAGGGGGTGGGGGSAGGEGRGGGGGKAGGGGGGDRSRTGASVQGAELRNAASEKHTRFPGGAEQGAAHLLEGSPSGRRSGANPQRPAPR